MSMTIRDLIDELRAAGDTCGYDAPVFLANASAMAGDSDYKKSLRLMIELVRTERMRCLIQVHKMQAHECELFFSGVW